MKIDAGKKVKKAVFVVFFIFGIVLFGSGLVTVSSTAFSPLNLVDGEIYRAAMDHPYYVQNDGSVDVKVYVYYPTLNAPSMNAAIYIDEALVASGVGEPVSNIVQYTFTVEGKYYTSGSHSVRAVVDVSGELGAETLYPTSELIVEDPTSVHYTKVNVVVVGSSNLAGYEVVVYDFYGAKVSSDLLDSDSMTTFYLTKGSYTVEVSNGFFDTKQSALTVDGEPELNIYFHVDDKSFLDRHAVSVVEMVVGTVVAVGSVFGYKKFV